MKCVLCGITKCHSWSSVFIEGKLEWVCDGCRKVSSYKSEASAIYKREDGSTFAVDQRGNVMDKHPYERDPRGWKRAGKSTEGYHRSLILDQGGNVKKEVRHR